MRGTRKAGSGWATWGDVPLLPCFLAALLAAAMIVSDGPRLDDMARALFAIVVSAGTACYGLGRGLARSARLAIGRAGGALAEPAGLESLAAVDHVIIDGVSSLRRVPRMVAAHQPNLDPRLKALLCALAEQSQHILSKDVAGALQSEQIKADPLADIGICASGGVTAEWRGHHVSLVVPSASYGARQLCLGLMIDGEAAASLYFDENFRIDAAPLIARLKKIGVVPMLYDPDAVHMMGCAARQLDVMIRAQMGEADWAQALERQQAAGYQPLVLRRNDDGSGFLLMAPDREQRLLEAETLSAIPASIALARRYKAALRFRGVGVGSIALVAAVLALAGLHPTGLAGGVILSAMMLIMPLRYMILADTGAAAPRIEACEQTPASL